MTFLYPNPVLQMKYSFWRINLHVRCRSGYRSKSKCCTQRWSFLADWKRVTLRKGFSHSFWCTRDKWQMKFFVSKSVCSWRKGKCFTLLSQLATFFSKQLSYLRPIFVNLSTENSCIVNWLLLLKKRLKKLKLKEDEIIGRKKKNRISEYLLDLSTENMKFRRYCILSLFGQWNQSKEFPNQLSWSGSRAHPLQRNIKGRQRIFFLFVDWANWKFFFLWKKCFVSHLFFLSLKVRF